MLKEVHKFFGIDFFDMLILEIALIKIIVKRISF